MSVAHSSPTLRTAADLLRQIGAPPDRILLVPAPGTATVADVIEMERRENRLCELVDGTLVEKAMGYRESVLAGAILEVLRIFVRSQKLGIVNGADGMVALYPDLVRIPDVAFASWNRLPGQRLPTEPVPNLVPDLAVEVLSPSNMTAEMARKQSDYLEAGVRLLWFIDPETRTVAVSTSADSQFILMQSEILDGGNVLPGFQLPLQSLFAELGLAQP